MLKAKINENGVFEINRGGAMQAMICPFGTGNCGVHCPFFDFRSAQVANVVSLMPFEGKDKKIELPNQIRLTCMENHRVFEYLKDKFIDERVK